MCIYVYIYIYMYEYICMYVCYRWGYACIKKCPTVAGRVVVAVVTIERAWGGGVGVSWHC